MDTMPTVPPFMFCHPIEISAQDIDAMGHVNTAVYLKWVQEAVVRYWQHRSPPQAQAELLWVALKHVILYRLPLFLDDQVEAHVMATATRGTRASFTTEFKRGDDLVAEVRSSWCCVDAATGVRAGLPVRSLVPSCRMMFDRSILINSQTDEATVGFQLDG